MADVVVWSHSPLSVYARAETVFVDGHLVFDRARGPAPDATSSWAPCRPAGGRRR